MSEEIGRDIIRLLYESGVIKTWPKDNKDGWFLCNEKWSPYYINLREMFSKPSGQHIMQVIGQGMVELVEEMDVDGVVGVATAGIPFSTLITYLSGTPSCYTAKVSNIPLSSLRTASLSDIVPQKKYGEPNLVEGDLAEQDAIALVDDIITDGSSKIYAKILLEREAERRGITVECVGALVVVDREQGGEHQLTSEGMKLRSLVPFQSKGLEWLAGVMDDEEVDIITDHFRHPKKYKTCEARTEMMDSFRQSQ